jgi:Cd2+/Zn2+-exporting ATPase
VTRIAKSKHLNLPSVKDVSTRVGLGIVARLDGKQILVGGINLLSEEDVTIPPGVAAQALDLEREGKTIMFVARAGELVGLLAAADSVRSDARSAIADLSALGLRRQVMLTGDNEAVAAAVAAELDLSDYRAELMPESKLVAIGELVKDHGVVAMVGDGVNDAPALAAATVGIAMGGAGTDVALETADVALMADDLSKLPFAISLGRATRAIIRQNLFTSLTVISVLVTLALSGLAGIGLAILLHEGSTVLVVLNSLRLLNHRVV